MDESEALGAPSLEELAHYSLTSSTSVSAGPESTEKKSVPHNWASKWTDAEDARLVAAIQEHGIEWRKVAEAVGTRDQVKCLQRWEKVLKPGIVKGRWTDAEDNILVVLVSKGYKSWGKVADSMPGRTSKQCRERWNNFLDPTLIRTSFTEKEDEMLLKLHADNGNKWALIARALPGRSENAVKVRCNSLLKTSQQPSASSSSSPMHDLHIAQVDCSSAAESDDQQQSKRQRLPASFIAGSFDIQPISFADS